jgi:transcriptional regulator with XRE-family HTH domain
MSIANMSSRLQAVRMALAGFPGAPRTQRQIAQAMGLDPANFNHMLSGRRPFTPATLARLHQVLRLESLGVEFDIEFWTEATDGEMVARIKAARGGDLADAIASRLAATPFFEFVSDAPNALIFTDVDSGAHPWPAIAQKPAKVGATLVLEVAPPMDGLLKLVCVEGGEAIGLDAYFGLTHHKLRHGVQKRFARSFSVRAHPPEALFVALMSPEPFGPEWPTRDEPAARLSSRAFAELVRTTLAMRPDIQVAATRLFAV